jgi:hypothetical protein
MTLTELLLTDFSVNSGAMLLLWLISIPIRNASIVDIFWGPAFAASCWIAGSRSARGTRDISATPASGGDYGWSPAMRRVTGGPRSDQP